MTGSSSCIFPRGNTFLLHLMLCMIFCSMISSVYAQRMKINQPPSDVTPLPLEFTSRGVLFRIKAPNVKSVYVLGSFNNFADQHLPGDTIDESDKMYGPSEDGMFEQFYPLTPGTHSFAFSLEGDYNRRVYGHKSLPTEEQYYKNNKQSIDDYSVRGSVFNFSLNDPPWPSYVPSNLMAPAIVMNQQTNKPYLRVRFFSRSAKSVHVMGSWDGWKGGDGALVEDSGHQMQPTRVPDVWEYYIGPVPKGDLMYKIVVDNLNWMSDPTVTEANQHGNTVVKILNQNNNWLPQYTPRFSDNQKRADTEYRWSNQVRWIDARNRGFSLARESGKPMIWVITLPGSKLSDDFMRNINSDPDLVEKFKELICLETPADEVRDIIYKQGINRMPYVVLVNSHYVPTKRYLKPSLEQLKIDLAMLE